MGDGREGEEKENYLKREKIEEKRREARKGGKKGVKMRRKR